ncbi:MAG: HAD family phosphatase [Paludibacteraceae bacterium]|nr:HAD family phosphatase [Prevotella sp.]MBQ8705840.1 HAD family phosphatase [Paludibacteraceae bacterium]MBQ8715668.1 HAD family phosphatase [Prevotella sp.]
MRYKLMLIDCDRTLLNDEGQITERTRKAIKKALRNGVKVVFASGRAPSGVENVIRAIALEGLFDYYVCFNGGMIVRSKDKRIISEHVITVNDVNHLANTIRCTPKDYYVLTSNRLICQRDNLQASIEAKKNSMNVAHEDIRQLGDDEKIFKMVFAGEQGMLDKLEQEIPEGLRKKYNVTRSEPNNLEFVSLHASKGYALLSLIDLLHVSISETICVGDSENDISMLNLAGTGVAMGNACEKVKDIADYVTDSNNNDGLAKAIETLVLSK